MNAPMEHTQEQSSTVLQAKYEPSNGGTATIEDNRPETILQRKLQETMRNSSGNIHQVASEGVQGSGSRLPHFYKIQKSFGQHDISAVQAFTDTKAASASHAIGASAYTTGNKIAFTSKSPDLHTAAHEAAHAVQQRAGVQLSGGVGQVGDQYERHADAVANKVVSGQSAESLLSHYKPGKNTNNSTDVQKLARVGGSQKVQSGNTCGFYALEAALRCLGKNPADIMQQVREEMGTSGQTLAGEIFNFEQLNTAVDVYNRFAQEAQQAEGSAPAQAAVAQRTYNNKKDLRKQLKRLIKANNQIILMPVQLIGIGEYSLDNQKDADHWCMVGQGKKSMFKSEFILFDPNGIAHQLSLDQLVKIGYSRPEAEQTFNHEGFTESQFRNRKILDTAAKDIGLSSEAYTKRLNAISSGEEAFEDKAINGWFAVIS